MLDGSRIKHAALRRCWVSNDDSKIRPDWRRRVRRILNAQDVAASPQELDVPGFNFHPLTGDRKGSFSVLVSRNWRVTFRWSSTGHPYDVDMEDYHGK
jgi:proteic killer suppression protein